MIFKRRDEQPLLSDDWIRKGYTHGPNICIVDILTYYRLWHDSNNVCIGVSIDFEYAEDVHYELTYHDWCRFLEEELECSQVVGCHMLLQSYFSGRSCFIFEDALKRKNIAYCKIAHY